jgi:hypothetical protein
MYLIILFYQHKNIIRMINKLNKDTGKYENT